MFAVVALDIKLPSKLTEMYELSIADRLVRLTQTGVEVLIPKEFEKSTLVLELKAGKKRLENALRGLSDEQSERTGATHAGSVMDVLSMIVNTEILALKEVFDRQPGLPMNHLTNKDERTGIAPGSVQLAASKSIETLLADFGVLRSVLIRHVESRRLEGATVDAQYGSVAGLCVTKFNERVEEIERWRGTVIVGFSAGRLREEAREAELNQAIVDLSREDFLVGNFDLKSLFLLLLEWFYSDDFVLWFDTEELSGKYIAFRRMGDVLEPFHTLFEMGMAFVESFGVTASLEDGERNFVTDWETVLGGMYSTRVPVRWRTIRVWKSRVVIAERIEHLPSA